jgi:quaternary ammonium compound-resistance protein SugE
MAWIFLFLAGLFEIVWAVAMKASAGFSRLAPTLIMLAGMAASFILLAKALKDLPLGTAYTVWTGIGAVGTVVLGIWMYRESTDPLRLLFITLIIAGIVGLKLTSPQ